MSGTGEYISRDAAIEAMYKDAEAHPDHTFWTTQHEALRNIPAADVRPRWIPVTERLPQEYVNVLVFLHSLDWNSIYYSIDHLMEDGQWWKASTSWKHEVTHWMPLPEPPSLFDELDALAIKTGVSKSEMIREATMEYVNRRTAEEGET